ncbi:MAG: uroporphyrinogen decarboxylase family protein [Oscillospiraceae bacterium]|jgi:hypothetical protein
MTERENLLLALNHETPKWTPYYSHDVAIVSSSLMNEDGPIGGGLDYWGVKWIHDDMGPMVDVNDPPLIDDVTRWRELIRVPDIDAMDWKKQCEEDLAAQKPDRDNKLVILFTKKGFCERLMALLGYEGFLISLYEEPEAVCDLLDTLADFRCKMLDRLIYYFKPDIVICGGDFSSGTNLLMAPDVWRKIIKPYIKREIDVVRSHGLFVDFHSCGKCESVVEEFYEMGAHLWSSAQVMNDINSLLTKLENRMCMREDGTVRAPRE